MRGKVKSWRLETSEVVEKPFMDQQFPRAHCHSHLIESKVLTPVELNHHIPYAPFLAFVSVNTFDKKDRKGFNATWGRARR